MSRESSVYAPASTTSSAGTSRTTRATRAKRGSESQESDSGRETKRTTQSRSQSDHSGGETEAWCGDCKVPLPDCRNKKAHHRKNLKKTEKEQTSREEQARVLQMIEDLLESGANWRSPKEQMPGNKKKSGLVGDKQHMFNVGYIGVDMLVEMAARNGDFNATMEEFRRRIDFHLENGSPRDLPTGSLMAPSPSSDDEIHCTDDPSHQSCDNSIDCRKTTRRMHCHANLGRIMGVPAASLRARRSTATARSRTSMSRRH